MEYLILLVSLVGIILGADNLVSGSVAVARRFGVSDFVIGALIVGIGTSMPEFVVSTYGALTGSVDVAVGNVVGSNIFNVLGILGITALICPIAVTRSNMWFEMPFCIAVSVLVTLLSFGFVGDGQVSLGRLDGALLFVLFALFIYISFVRDRRSGATNVESVTESAPHMKMWQALLRVVGGLGVLIASCHFFVEEAVAIATAWGLDEAYISITLIACGTSLPELAASLVAAAKRNTQLALGNIVGSNIFNITFILGIGSLITELGGGNITIIDYAVMIVAALLPMILGASGKISRVSGALMLAGFVLYNIYLIGTQNINL